MDGSSLSGAFIPVSDSAVPDCAPCPGCDYWRTVALALLDSALTRVPGFSSDEKASVLELLATMAPERAA